MDAAGVAAKKPGRAAAASGLPYLAPLSTFGLNLGSEPWQFVAACVPVILVLMLTSRDLRVMFSPLLALMPRQKPVDRWTESMFFALPALVQE